ncbi:MAG: DUF3108 domain-containing protein [Dehalococcoidia bacterium]
MRLLIIASVVLGGFFAMSACLQAKPVTTRDIVANIPWGDEEQATYVLLKDNGKDELGNGTLSIERQGDEFEFRSEFANEDASDSSVMHVDAETLKPHTIRREIHDKDEAQILDATYNTKDKILEIVQVIDGKRLPRPERLDREHYYDNETSAFLWRTINFRKDYQAYYYSILANQGGDDQLLRLEVVGKEEIEVPAGKFNAWRLEISTPRGLQTAWYTDTPEHTLVRYDTTRNVLELRSMPRGS